MASVVRYPVDGVRSSTSTELSGGILSVDCRNIEELATVHSGVTGARVRVVSPGENVRLVHLLDSAIPVTVGSEARGGAFPGITSPVSTIAHGPSEVHQLDGIVVTVLARFKPGDHFLRQLEAVVDMSGPGQLISPLGQLHHVTIEIEFGEKIENLERGQIARTVMAEAAERLASTAIDSSVAGTVIEGRGIRGDLTIAHICQICAGDHLWDTLIAGKSATDMLPTLVGPADLVRGLVVNADYRKAGHRNLTCFYQANPIGAALGREAGKSVGYVTILMPIGGSGAAKERSAGIACRMASALRVDGAIITGAAAGNAHIDVMQACAACEAEGIPTCLLLDEMSGPSGEEFQMVHSHPSAKQIISTGNLVERVTLPPVDSVLGGARLMDSMTSLETGMPAHGELTLDVEVLVGANSQLGAGRLHAVSI